MALTRDDLDNLKCSDPTCTDNHDVLYIHSGCHPHAPVEAAYIKATGVLEFHCKKCGKPVAAVLVARRERVQ